MEPKDTYLVIIITVTPTTKHTKPIFQLTIIKLLRMWQHLATFKI